MALEVPDRNLIVKTTYDDAGLATVLATYKADGLTMEMIKPFYTDHNEFFTATMPDRLKFVELEP